jgi:hypothetical protein
LLADQHNNVPVHDLTPSRLSGYQSKKEAELLKLSYEIRLPFKLGSIHSMNFENGRGLPPAAAAPSFSVSPLGRTP